MCAATWRRSASDTSVAASKYGPRSHVTALEPVDVRSTARGETAVTDGLVKIWCVSSQRLCNFHCPYCVSVNDYAKSNDFDWRRERDRTDFESIVRWIGSRPFRVGVRLATLGEPFTSAAFLSQAGWLTARSNVAFVELLTNGSLLKKRLPTLASTGDIKKISLWVTHHKEISIARLIENAVWAREEYGCFVVVNGLLFPDNASAIGELRSAAEGAGLRFNLDLGYDPATPAGAHSQASVMAPMLRLDGGRDTALRLGANAKLLNVNLIGLENVHQQACSAGHNYLYIGIDGDVYPCSRYYVLKKNRLGNVLDRDFQLNLRQVRWTHCEATCGCCNKEDFLNLQLALGLAKPGMPSLGWVGDRKSTRLNSS